MSSHTLLEIDVDQEIRKVLLQLSNLPDMMKAPDVLTKAINATANEYKREMGRKARKRYAVTDNRILTQKDRGGMYLERAGGARVQAALISKGAMVDVMSYMTHPNTETTAAMLKVLNESSMTSLEVDGRKAFETTFKSGHTAIVQRRGKERLPVKKLLAPAVPFLFGKIYHENERGFYERLQKQIQRQVDCALGKRAA